MNMQEVFDKAVNGIRAQGALSVNGEGLCCYRGPAETKCFVGQLITDEAYDPELEGAGASMWSVRVARVSSGVGGLPVNFLVDCQDAHDDADDLDEFEEAIAVVAEKYDLRL